MAALPHPSDLPEALHGLAQLGRDGELDMRPVLLRVLTDLFVGRERQTPDEIRQFETIALGLLDKTDPDTRAIVAAKLANCGATPPALAERIVADGGAPAVALLTRSNVLPRPWLLCAALGEASDLAAAVASRADLYPELCSVLVTRPEIEVARALAANISAPLDADSFRALVARGAGDKALGAALCARASDPRDIEPLFLHASSTQRASILLNARRADLGSPTRKPPNDIERATAAEIEAAALKHDATLYAAIVARALGTSLPTARALLEDARGEALALTLCALHVDAEAAARIFMCAGESIAHNAERVRALTRLVAEIAPATAMRLVRAMVMRDAPVNRAPTHVPVMDNEAKSAPARPLDGARMAERPRGGGLLFMRKKA